MNASSRSRRPRGARSSLARRSSRPAARRSTRRSAPAPPLEVVAVAPAALGPYATVGRDVGGLLGFAPLGERVGGAIGRLFGRGDYSIRSNSLMESYGRPAAGPPPPAVFKNGKRGVRVVEREYLGDIRSGVLDGASTVFTNAVYPINPGVSTTFPWLSKIARQFDQWEPHGIVFEFRSTSSEYNGASQALGTIILATDYDTLDSAYTSKAEAENSDYAMSVKSSDCAIHGIECQPGERPTPVLFTRDSSYPPTADPRMYDLGKFQIATQGMSVAGVNLGELWVSYDITFYKKQLNADVGPENSLVAYSWSNTASTDDYFGTESPGFKTWGNFDNSLSTGTYSVNSIALPASSRVGDTYFIEINYLTTSGQLSTPTFAAHNGEIFASGDLLLSPELGLAQVTWNSAAGESLYRFYFRKTATGPAYVSLTGGTIANVALVCTTMLQIPTNRLPFPLTPYA